MNYPDLILNELALTDQNRAWMTLANCRGMDPQLFFPERGTNYLEARAVCDPCVVKQDCLDYALNNRERHGIWGGYSERERRTLRRDRNVRLRENAVA